MNTQPVIHVLLLTGFFVTQPQLLAQETSGHTLPDDPTRAWAEVEKVHQALRPPQAWGTSEPTPEQAAEFQNQVRQTAASFADKAREFMERFPANENVGDARITVVLAFIRVWALIYLRMRRLK
jgi:hypothetical protein